MMPDAPYLGASRQKLVEVAAPLRGVLPLAQAQGFCPVQDRLDAAADTTGRFGLLGPDRLQNLEHESGVDRAHRQVTEDRVGVCDECVTPLLPVLSISPTRLVRCDQLLSGLFE